MVLHPELRAAFVEQCRSLGISPQVGLQRAISRFIDVTEPNDPTDGVEIDLPPVDVLPDDDFVDGRRRPSLPLAASETT